MGRASDSSEQQTAEAFLVASVSRIIGKNLRPQRINLPSGPAVQIDGYNSNGRTLCEVYARIGKLKSAQAKKVASDFLKMLLIEKELGGSWEKHYCFASDEAAQQVSGKSWLANAAKEFGIAIHVFHLPVAETESVLKAQYRQRMVNPSPVPKYIENRFRRRPPANCGVVPNSVPIVSFGDAHSARIATLGLNPSHVEFSGGHVWNPDANWSSAPIELIGQVVRDQYQYFQRDPYHWFNRLEIVLNACGASYYNGSAANLDLVQWATNPIWSRLKTSQKRRLLDDDIPFLNQQLKNENIEILLVNGQGVINELQSNLSPNLTPVEVVKGIPGTERIPDTVICSGRLFDRVTVISWNVNLQGTPGIGDEDVRQIAEGVKRVKQRIEL